MRAPGDVHDAYKRQLERGGLDSENGWRFLMAGGRFGVREDACSSASFESCAQPRVIELDISVRHRTAGLFALTVFAEDRSDDQRFGARPWGRDTARGLGH